MSLLKSRRVFVAIVLVALTSTLFATESFAAKAAKPACYVQDLTSADFTTSFSAMKALVPLAKKGKGKVAGDPSGHRVLDPLDRVRCAVPQEGAAGRRTQVEPDHHPVS